MAGNYMNAPASRLAFDRDGSIGVAMTTTGTLTQLTQSQLQGLNGETETIVTLPANTVSVAIIFPIPMDVAALFVAASGTSGLAIQGPKDTSNGVDGAWLPLTASQSYFRDVKPNYRIGSALSVAAAGNDSSALRGVRVTAGAVVITSFLRAIHVYAEANIAATPDRLDLWHPTADVALAPTQFDWGDVPRSSSADRSFRVKNLSQTLTANSVAVYIEALTPGSPSVAGMHTVSIDGVNFLTSITIPTIAPGAISPIITLRRVVPANAQVSVWSARVAADVASWT